MGLVVSVLVIGVIAALFGFAAFIGDIIREAADNARED